MNNLVKFTVITAALLLGGCASLPPQTPIELNAEAVSPKGGRLGVVMTAVPKINTYFPGAGCLLCIAVAEGVNSTLSDHILTQSDENLANLKEEVAALIRKKGGNVKVIAENIDLTVLPVGDEAPNMASKDHKEFKAKYELDKLLVIDISMFGVERTYSAYVPTSDPKGVFRGVGYIVNLDTNMYEWYVPVNIIKSAEGNWDEPPKYPGVTNAYYQALELGKDSFRKPFSK